MYTADGKLNKSDLIESYYPLVRRIAFNLKVKLPASVEVDDLIQAGLEGLLVCVDRFDPDTDVAFSTFAHQRIRGAMIDELRSRDWLPRSARRYGREIARCIHQLEQTLGRAPEEYQVAEALGISIDEYRKCLLDTNNGLILSLDGSGDEGDPFDTLVDNTTEEPEQKIGSTELKQQVQEAIKALPDREQLVMALYYQEELNLKEIGAVLDVTESRVSQLHSQAIKRIQSRLMDY